MKPEQCRAARALLDWTQAELARVAGLSDLTVRDFEKAKRTPTEGILKAIKGAFEQNGVVMLDDASRSETGGVGVRFGLPDERPDYGLEIQRLEETIEQTERRISELENELSKDMTDAMRCALSEIHRVLGVLLKETKEEHQRVEYWLENDI